MVFCSFAMGVGAYCYYNLPLLDFLPYKKGANIYEMITAKHDTGEEDMATEEYVLVYRNRRTGRVREFSIDDKEWQNEAKWEWVETRVDNETSPVQTLLGEFSLSDVEGDVTEQILSQKGKVYMICVTRFDKVSRRCAERLRKVVEFAESPRDSYQAIREARERAGGSATLQGAIDALTEAVHFENCTIDKEYILSLGLNAE